MFLRTLSPCRSRPLGTATNRHPALPHTGSHPLLPKTCRLPVPPNMDHRLVTGHYLLPNMNRRLLTGRHLPALLDMGRHPPNMVRLPALNTGRLPAINTDRHVPKLRAGSRLRVIQKGAGVGLSKGQPSRKNACSL
jgi:hypothetical protein